MAKLTRQILKQQLRYDPKTGFWVRLIANAKNVKIGVRAGGVHPKGYRTLAVLGVRYSEHRLAWFYMTGRWPRIDIDHKDTNPQNNSWSNLRLATDGQNLSNSKIAKNNKSGYKGVHWNKELKKWRAQVGHQKKIIYLGDFTSVEKAALAYRIEAVRLKGAFARFL